MFKLIKKIILVLFIVITIYLVYFFYTLLRPLTNDYNVKKFTVSDGQSFFIVANNLKKENIISDPYVFSLYFLWTKNVNKVAIKPGEFKLKSSQNIISIVNSLNSVNREEKTITIIEGWTQKDIANYLDKEGLLKKDEVLAALKKDYSAQYSILADKPTNTGYEGYLFPDTYRVYSDATVQDVILKMLNNFDSRYNAQMRRDTVKANMTVFQVVTLASILEKEVATDKDRAMVASIFYKRLNKGMYLGSDATINYITGKGMEQPTYKDLEVSSPYNTYKNKGLPPTPICNPGLSAIMAAIYPEKNDYWYFLTTKDNKVIYSKTYQEHLKNKAKYLD